MVDRCFDCGAVLLSEKCGNCGYGFSLDFTCPRLNGMRCVHTKSICKVGKDWLNCKVLRAND